MKKNNILINNHKKIDVIQDKLKNMGQRVNCQDGTFNEEDLLQNAEEIIDLLSEFVKLKNQSNEIILKTMEEK